MKRFTVIDGCNAFYLLDNVTGREVCLGDGVDVVFGDTRVGEEGFVGKWEKDANYDICAYMEAYFYDLYELEIRDDEGETFDRYTVFIEPASLAEVASFSRSGLARKIYNGLSLSCNPDSPQGVSMWCLVDADADFGGLVSFLDLPTVIQAHIAKRLEE